MSDFNPFAARHIGSALSLGGLAALMTSGPLRPEILALSSTCLVGSLAAFAAHACFGGARRRPAKASKAAQPVQTMPEWEDAESWELPPSREVRNGVRTLEVPHRVNSMRLLTPNGGAVPSLPRTAPIKGLHSAMLMEVVTVRGPSRPGGAAEPSRKEHRQALAHLKGRLHTANER
ncbi:hypothetical protein PMNALOAF_3271 [Methylobacterium adhaesivum]|jgi:hypothetical protein|uniref:Transmembrane protein n=1 Tax=Methylobacterium adhaesivum TaxID=333297 RepID=A0ABT8BBF3_9HYPH|nr:hypothetical protein [Methylobacterium adhaesivum]MDN3589120.1 hypothetical protein [Methylobacterium adhaesivum]GJD32006.1 hypothetical protein PMNALOAF_3271 [Methylobacterium adhaesivum]